MEDRRDIKNIFGEYFHVVKHKHEIPTHLVHCKANSF